MLFRSLIEPDSGGAFSVDSLTSVAARNRWKRSVEKCRGPVDHRSLAIDTCGAGRQLPVRGIIASPYARSGFSIRQSDWLDSIDI